MKMVPGGTFYNSSTWNHTWSFWFHSSFSPSASDGPSISPGNLPESPTGLHPMVPSPVATTAPPVNLLNHHSTYRRPQGHQGPFSPQRPHYPGDGGGLGSWSGSWSGSRPNFSTVREQDATPPPSESSSTAAPATSAVSTEANADDRNQRRKRRSGRDEEETTTSTITTTTITTTVQSPGESCGSSS